jgi:hypothetical protein
MSPHTPLRYSRKPNGAQIDKSTTAGSTLLISGIRDALTSELLSTTYQNTPELVTPLIGQEWEHESNASTRRGLRSVKVREERGEED